LHYYLLGSEPLDYTNSMMHSLITDCAKNYCNWTLIVQVIAEHAVTCFF